MCVSLFKTKGNVNYHFISTIVHTVQFITSARLLTHQKACISEFFVFLFFSIHSSGRVADQVRDSVLFLNLHECACLVGFVAVTDKFYSHYVTYKYTIRIPSSMLYKGAPGT